MSDWRDIALEARAAEVRLLTTERDAALIRLEAYRAGYLAAVRLYHDERTETARLRARLREECRQ